MLFRHGCANAWHLVVHRSRLSAKSSRSIQFACDGRHIRWPQTKLLRVETIEHILYLRYFYTFHNYVKTVLVNDITSIFIKCRRGLILTDVIWMWIKGFGRYFRKNDAFLTGENNEWSLFTTTLALAVLPQYMTAQELCAQFALHSWWRHEMETFSALLAICSENSPVPGEFPAQRPVTRSFDVFFDLHLSKRLIKQS